MWADLPYPMKGINIPTTASTEILHGKPQGLLEKLSIKALKIHEMLGFYFMDFRCFFGNNNVGRPEVVGYVFYHREHGGFTQRKTQSKMEKLS